MGHPVTAEVLIELYRALGDFTGAATAVLDADRRNDEAFKAKLEEAAVNCDAVGAIRIVAEQAIRWCDEYDRKQAALRN